MFKEIKSAGPEFQLPSWGRYEYCRNTERSFLKDQTVMKGIGFRKVLRTFLVLKLDHYAGGIACKGTNRGV